MIRDEFGAIRHTMTASDIRELYVQFCNFLADCTTKEYEQWKEEIIGVKTLLHKRECDALEDHFEQQRKEGIRAANEAWLKARGQ